MMLNRPAIFRLFAAICLLLVTACPGWAARLGLFTDNHFDRVTNDNTAYVATMIAKWTTLDVDAVICLGDTYNGNFTDLADAQADIGAYEAAWSGFAIPMYWGLGNHDHWGITNNEYVANSAYTPAVNFTFDIPNSNYRVVFYSNVDGTYFSATAETLTWLTSALSTAAAADKKILVATHCRIDQDYPGTPAAWTTEPYSAFSYNSDEQRAVIEAAKTAGADIVAVIQGHQHINATSTVAGIDYYEFASSNTAAKYSIIELDDDGIDLIAGYGGQTSYGVDYYVNASTGDDTNNSGLYPNDAWATVTKLEATATNPGSVGHIAAGTYTENVTINSAGTSAAHLRWIFADGAIIAGTSTSTLSIAAGTDYFDIINPTITNGSTAGINISATGVNHLVINGAETYGCGSGISCNGTGGINIVNFSSHDNSNLGINISGSSDVVFCYGKTYENTNRGIYLSGTSLPKIYNVTSSKNAYGVYASSSGAAVLSNILAYDNTTKDLYATSAAVNTVVNNSLYGTITAGAVTYLNMITADPLFENATSNDFRLKINSPCIDDGRPIGGLYFDFAGKLIYGMPDIGAYERTPGIVSGATHRKPLITPIIREVIQ